MIGFGMLVLVLGLAGAANAVIINYNYQLQWDGTSNNNFTSIYTNNVETFDTTAIGSLPVNYVGGGGGAQVVNGSWQGHWAAPMGDSVQDRTNYLVVPATGSTGWVDISFNQTYNYLGLWWGSIDTYNAVFFYDGVPVANFTGTDATNDPDGSWTGDWANRYVNFLDLPAFNSVRLQSDGVAMEIDNLAVANVPEPATMLTLGLALLGLAGLKRKFEL